MTAPGVIASRRSERRPGLAYRAGAMLLVSLLVLAVGWSVLWLFARREAERSFAMWVAAERAQGRIWTCPSRRIGGFPLGIVLTCEQPTFAEAGNDRFKGELAGLRADARLYFPTSVAIDLAGPLVVHQKGDPDLVVSWSNARVTLRGDLPGDLDRGELGADGVAIVAGTAAPLMRIGHGEIGVKPKAAAADGSADAELSFKVVDAQSPDADSAFGSADPIAADVKGLVSDLPRQGASLPNLLEQWREAGGKFDIEHLTLGKGSFEIEGDGRVRIDDQHRIEGRIDARFAGLEPVAARFGIPVGAVKIGGVLSGLFGAKPAKTEAANQNLGLPLVARDGRLYVGPFKTGVVMAPLY